MGYYEYPVNVSPHVGKPLILSNNFPGAAVEDIVRVLKEVFERAAIRTRERGELLDRALILGNSCHFVCPCDAQLPIN